MGRKTIAVCDAETDPFEKGKTDIKPFIWGFYDGKKYLEFFETETFINYVKERDLILFAHNAGKFDWHFILDYIEPFTEMLVINSRISNFKIGKCTFRDSYNILPFPLSHFKKEEFEYWKMAKEHRQKYMSEIRQYLKSDCLNLHEIVMKFIDRFGRRITTASAALDQCKKIEEIEVPKSSKFFHDEIKPFYYGGRCQAFYKGEVKGNINIIDINSAYPFAMLHSHPYFPQYQTCDYNDEEIEGHNFYIVEGIAKGSLPFKDSKGALIFPNDNIKRNYYVTGWELKTAIETKTIYDYEIKGFYYFNSTIDFKKYVETFWKEKLVSEKGTPEYIFSKLMLNSCYGKFGSNPENYHSYQTFPKECIQFCEEKMGYTFEREFKNSVLMKRKLDENEQRYYNVATAASITGFVRAYLFKAIHEIQKIGHVLYCDTDSIAFKYEIGYPWSKLINCGGNLGEWQSEGNFDYGAIGGKKLYAFKYTEKNKWKTASKGVRLKYNDIVDIVKNPGKMIVYENEGVTFSLKKEPHIISRQIKMT